MTTAATQKLQLLADALALEFSQSLASAQCAAALKRVLPGLQYLSIAVSNPAQAGSIVASANCAAEGPTTLHLHDPISSVVGLAMDRGQPLQTSLVGDAAAKAVPGLTDVQQMVAAAPAATHLLCIPFGCGDGGDGAAGAAPPCEVHGAAGSGTGALLFGLAGPPELDDRRKTALAMLAQCLPAPMARLSADTLAFVNLACGNAAQCSCCCPHDSDGEEEEGIVPGSPCGDDRHPNGGGGAGAPGQALRVPAASSPAAGDKAGAAADPDRAGPSSHGWQDPAEGKRRGKAAAAAAAAAAGAAAARMPREVQPAAPPLRFSKALVAAAGEGAGVAAQNPLTLAFRSPLMEREYGRWVARYHFKVDLLFSLLLATALTIVSFVRPYRLIDLTPGSMLLGLGMLLPLAASWFSRRLYTAWRDRLVVAMRLYVVAFINLVSLRSYQALLAPERVQQWVTFWMLTGAESLCVTALGFPIRMQLHLPLQFAAMGVAAWNLPRMCSECYPDTDPGVCFKSSATMAAVFGYLLPTLGLSYLEQRSRAAFASRLHAAAAHER